MRIGIEASGAGTLSCAVNAPDPVLEVPTRAVEMVATFAVENRSLVVCRGSVPKTEGGL